MTPEGAYHPEVGPKTKHQLPFPHSQQVSKHNVAGDPFLRDAELCSLQMQLSAPAQMLRAPVFQSAVDCATSVQRSSLQF